MGSASADGLLTLSFVQPTDVDPTHKTFTQYGPGGALTATGLDLLPGTPSLPGGIEIHSQISNEIHTGIYDVNEIELDFAFSGAVNVSPSAPFDFTDWTWTAHESDVEPGRWSVIFQAQSGSVPINDN